MSLLARLLTPSAGPYKDWDDFWYNPTGFTSKTLSGMRVSAEAAMRLSVVFACVRIVAETIGVPPFKIYRRRGDEGKDPAPDHPAYYRLHDSPNDAQTSPEWREMMQGHVSLRGNAYSRIVRGPRGPGDFMLLPMHPDRVLPLALPSGRIGYIHTIKNGGKESFTQDEVLHLRGLSSDGVVGLSPLDLLREPIGLAMAGEAYAARYFENNGAPGGYLKHPKALSSTAHTRLLEWMKENHQGVMNAHKPNIFEEGMEWVQVGLDPEKMQMVFTRQFQVIDIARAFRVPLHLLNELTKPSYASIEQMSLEFITYERMPDFVKFEKRVDLQLISPRNDEFFAEFMLEGFLRGDIKTRYEAYSKATGGPWMARNEVRIKENLNPRQGLDEILSPLNMGGASSAPAVDGEDGSVLRQAQDVVSSPNHARLTRLLRASAGRISRREIGAVEKLLVRAGGDMKSFKDSVLTFYDEHARYVAEALAIGEEAANRYALFQARRICEAAERGTVPHLLSEFKNNGSEWVLAMTRKEGEKHDEDQIEEVLREAD